MRFNHQPLFRNKRRIAVYLPHQHLVRRFRAFSHLGSAISADCFTRPQYVLRSYWEAGRSRCPDREADMVAVQTLREQNTVQSRTPSLSDLQCHESGSLARGGASLQSSYLGHCACQGALSALDLTRRWNFCKSDKVYQNSIRSINTHSWPTFYCLIVTLRHSQSFLLVCSEERWKKEPSPVVGALDSSLSTGRRPRFRKALVYVKITALKEGSLLISQTLSSSLITKVYHMLLRYFTIDFCRALQVARHPTLY